MPSPLHGKVVIITGASSGIGAATARLLAQHGCKLALAARSVANWKRSPPSSKRKSSSPRLT